MIINHNIAALNTHRQWVATTALRRAVWKNFLQVSVLTVLEDDAAGLAISEKMRGQIRGLESYQKMLKMVSL